MRFFGCFSKTEAIGVDGRECMCVCERVRLWMKHSMSLALLWMGIVAASNEAAKKKLDLLFWRFYCGPEVIDRRENCVWIVYMVNKCDLAGLLAFAIIILREREWETGKDYTLDVCQFMNDPKIIVKKAIFDHGHEKFMICRFFVLFSRT